MKNVSLKWSRFVVVMFVAAVFCLAGAGMYPVNAAENVTVAATVTSNKSQNKFDDSLADNIENYRACIKDASPLTRILCLDRFPQGADEHNAQAEAEKAARAKHKDYYDCLDRANGIFWEILECINYYE